MVCSQHTHFVVVAVVAVVAFAALVAAVVIVVVATVAFVATVAVAAIVAATVPLKLWVLKHMYMEPVPFGPRCYKNIEVQGFALENKGPFHLVSMS